MARNGTEQYRTVQDIQKRGTNRREATEAKIIDIVRYKAVYKRYKQKRGTREKSERHHHDMIRYRTVQNDTRHTDRQ